VRRDYPQVWVSVSVTTRPPRPGETDGVEYHFVSEAEFARMVTAGELLEHDAHFSASYGTPRAPVVERVARGEPVLLEIDIHGARQVRAADPEALLIFLAPPTFDELARRLTSRGTEDPERLRARLDRARVEMAAEDEFDAVVVNDDVESAAARVVSLMIDPPDPAS
jgi:guanylate kinase